MGIPAASRLLGDVAKQEVLLRLARVLPGIAEYLAASEASWEDVLLAGAWLTAAAEQAGGLLDAASFQRTLYCQEQVVDAYEGYRQQSGVPSLTEQVVILIPVVDERD